MDKYILRSLFNFKEGLFHTITSEEEEIIQNTGLFNKLSEEQLQKLCQSIKLVKYAKWETILREGEGADSLYIVLKGSVLVFTHDLKKKKIPLAILEKGDFFGEQAFIGKSKNRNANIEATEEGTTLIKIDYKILRQNEEDLKKSGLIKRKEEQIRDGLLQTTKFYNFIESLVKKDSPTLIELKKGEILFKYGDLPNSIFLILQGEISLHFPNKTQLLLHKGHIFGELAILKNQPRLASALAHTDVRLIAIEGNKFKLYAKQHPELKEILTSLGKTYQIPINGAAEQYIGDSPENEPAIITVYQTTDGRTLISTTYLKKDLFSLQTKNTEGEKAYKYETADHWIELKAVNQYLTGIKAKGPWKLELICRFLFEKKELSYADLLKFEKTGNL